MEILLWLSGNNPTSIHEDVGSIYGFTQWLGTVAMSYGVMAVAMSYGVGHWCGLDVVLLWLWLTAEAPVHPLAWEFPYAEGMAQKSKKKKKKKKKRKKGEKKKKEIATKVLSPSGKGNGYVIHVNTKASQAYTVSALKHTWLYPVKCQNK